MGRQFAQVNEQPAKLFGFILDANIRLEVMVNALNSKKHLNYSAFVFNKVHERPINGCLVIVKIYHLS